ncbi:glycosyltransferase [Kordiimonas sp.]|uniref:glycosyltransferase n=1 Tax=Kordiimonas sp. TaxID=1970157 RepID=UPI003A95AF12
MMRKKLSLWRRRRDEVAVARQNFDEAFYLVQCPDVAKSGESAFKHFMKTGWREGLDPAPWFSVKAYLNAYPDIKKADLNPFVHYLTQGKKEQRPLPGTSDTVAPPPANAQGERERIEASSYFDATYYAALKPPLPPGTDPLQHFMERGWRDGRRPSLLFDIKEFDRQIGNRRNEAVNPILDLLDSGLEGTIRLNRLGLRKAQEATAPTDKEWLDVKPLDPDGGAATVDIIVPVYRGYGDTLRCLYSVLSAGTEHAAELIVIDDYSPEPELSAKLERLAAKGLFTLLRNDENLGFVGTVNRGMALNAERDVVLLNADTEVYGDWLDRLLAHADTHADIATITPLSNNATICSYPETLKNNNFEIECSGTSLNEAAYAANKGQLTDVPTGVGFCFYIRRKALDEVGLFDEAAFAKGYGEENDFCVRVAGAGWRNVLAFDVFVKHRGEVSFAADAPLSQQKGLQAVLKKHPGYVGDVHRYIAHDAGRHARARLDAMRLKRAMGETALFISHDWGGGISKNIEDLRTVLSAEGVGVVTMRSLEHKSEHVSFDGGDGFFLPNLEELHVTADAGLIQELISILSPKLVHVHSLVAFLPQARAQVLKLIKQSGLPYYFTFHDYAPICPHGQFVTPAGDYCGEPDVDGCRNCLGAHPPVNGWVDIETYQNEYREFIRASAGCFAPSQNAANRANAFLRADICKAVPHHEHTDLGSPVKPKAGKPGKSRDLRLAFVGALGPHKGRAIMENCARDAWARGLKIAFRLFGYSDTGSGSIEKLTIMGKYRGDAECAEMLRGYSPDMLAFFSIWPETYNYALTLAFRLNIPPVVFDLGAMADRVRDAGFGHVLPVAWMKEPARVNEFLLTNPLKPLSKAEHKELVRTLENQGPLKLLSPDFYHQTAQ